jgi:hypothetical protein
MSESLNALPPSHAWVLRARRLLDESAEHLDGAALSRLNQARQAALEARAGTRRAPSDWLRALGLGAVTAGLALVLWRGWSPEIAPAGGALPAAPAATQVVAAPLANDARAHASPLAAPDFELLADPENYAVIEDLEFYAWLEQSEGSQDG